MIKLTNPDVTRGLTKVFANQDTLDKQRIEGFRNAFQLSVDKYLPILWQDLTDLTADLSMGTQPDKKWEVVNQQKSRNYLRRVINPRCFRIRLKDFLLLTSLHSLARCLNELSKSIKEHLNESNFYNNLLKC